MLGIPHRYLTRSLPGVGGEIKQRYEDFRVTEVPLYTPSGEGEHTYFEIEKRDLATREAIDLIARRIGVSPDEIGYAGLKDRRGITRQTLSVGGVEPDRVRELAIDAIKILWVNRHSNKLRIGHLRGNRFEIRVRGVCPDAEARLGPIIEAILARGMPNYFGPQRFGSRADAHTLGRDLLLGRWDAAVRRLLGAPASTERDPQTIEARRRFDAGDPVGARDAFPLQYGDQRRVLAALIRNPDQPERALRRMSEPSYKMYLSAYQAYLFNLIVEFRIDGIAGAESGLDAIAQGDLAYLHRNGAVFSVEDPAAEAERIETFELSPSGPLFGEAMPHPKGAPGALEAEVVGREGFEPVAFSRLFPRRILKGGRRPLRVPVSDLQWRIEKSDLLLRFFLPKGSYATTFIRELSKNEEVPDEFYADGEDERHRLWRPDPPVESPAGVDRADSPDEAGEDA